MARDELQTSFSFDEAAHSGGSHAVAASIAGYYADRPGNGIIIVVDPASDRPQVVAGGTETALRAAISTAVSAGASAIWSDAPSGGSTAPLDLRALPENVRAATDGAGVVAAEVGSVRRDDIVHSVAIWLDTGHGTVVDADRQQVLHLLAAAADRDRERAAEEAAMRASMAATAAAAAPDVDPLDAIADRDAFDSALDDFEGDEAVIALVDLDDFEQIAPDEITAIAELVAGRLVANCRGSDIVARLEDRRFAVLLPQAERSAAMSIVKRIHEQLGAAGHADGAKPVSATVAFAHQDGLLDLEEMLESAEHAIGASRRNGPGRLVLAS